jgi:hypothetical protein
MTDIEAKALALLNEVAEERGYPEDTQINRDVRVAEALCRAIEQHEAFKQKVSDAVGHVLMNLGARHWAENHLNSFIIPKPKPDPLVQVLTDTFGASFDADELRAALDDLGFEIREKGQ